jgi:hypothetical protein
MGILHVLLSPFFWILFLLSRLARLVGLEWPLMRLITHFAEKQAIARMQRGLKRYQPKKGDVFICSFPKSGTNWGMQIAYQIANRGKGEYEHIHDVVAWPDATKNGIAVPLDHEMANRSATGMRVIKTHAVAKDVPYSAAAKYVCIVRDPKDAIVSAHHFFKDVEFGYLIPSVPVWVRLVLESEGVNWVNFAHGYWEWRNRPNVLFLTFEEMKNDLEGSVQRIAELMGVTLTESEFEQVCYLSSYKYMKTIDDKFYPGRVAPLASPKGSMIRSGKKDIAGEMLSPEQQKRIDEHNLAQLHALGSDFPYQKLYMAKAE